MMILTYALYYVNKIDYIIFLCAFADCADYVVYSSTKKYP